MQTDDINTTALVAWNSRNEEGAIEIIYSSGTFKLYKIVKKGNVNHATKYNKIQK